MVSLAGILSVASGGTFDAKMSAHLFCVLYRFLARNAGMDLGNHD